jgi:Tn3 transposase DDE domain
MWDWEREEHLVDYDAGAQAPWKICRLTQSPRNPGGIRQGRYLALDTVYIGRAIDASARNGQFLNADLLKYLSPLGSEHINLTGDYQ